MAKKIKRSKWFAPYLGPGKTAARYLSGKSGVYIIKSGKSNQVLYVGYSGSDLYKTLYRHFQSWDDRSQQRVSYSSNGNYLVRVIQCSKAQAWRLEEILRDKLKPRDNPAPLPPDWKTDATGKKVYEEYKEVFPVSIKDFVVPF